MRTIDIAHSPDADDIFMYYAIKFGWVSKKDYVFKNVALDIESLNEQSFLNTYDISAISFAVYPHIKNEYALLKTASSFGDGYGPKLVKKKTANLKKHFSLALSGKWTTNALLARIYYPNASIVYMNFLDIEKAIIDGEVDAGVLIHESILTYDDSLMVEKEIFDIWKELISKNIPLPLGGMAVRRSMPLLSAIYCEQLLSKAIKVALCYKKLLSDMLIQRDLLRVDGKLLETYLNMYANNQSLWLNDSDIESLNTLYKLGYEHKIYDSLIDINDYFIPNEYEKDRFC